MKVAIDSVKGVAQNEFEINLWQKLSEDERKAYADVFACNNSMTKVLAEKLEANAKDSMKEEFNHFKKLLRLFEEITDGKEKRNNPDYQKLLEKEESLNKENETSFNFAENLIIGYKVARKHRLLLGDFFRSSSWGYSNTRKTFKVLDYGITGKMYKRLY